MVYGFPKKSTNPKPCMHFPEYSLEESVGHLHGEPLAQWWVTCAVGGLHSYYLQNAGNCCFASILFLKLGRICVCLEDVFKTP